MRSASARVAPTASDAPTADLPAAGAGPDVSASPTFEVLAGGTLSIGASTRSGSNGTRVATASGRAPPEAPDPSRLYADRYRLVGLLAGGGNGEV